MSHRGGRVIATKGGNVKPRMKTHKAVSSGKSLFFLIAWVQIFFVFSLRLKCDFHCREFKAKKCRFCCLTTSSENSFFSLFLCNWIPFPNSFQTNAVWVVYELYGFLKWNHKENIWFNNYGITCSLLAFYSLVKRLRILWMSLNGKPTRRDSL